MDNIVQDIKEFRQNYTDKDNIDNERDDISNIVQDIKEFRQNYTDYNKDNIDNGRDDISFERGKDHDQWDETIYNARGKRPKIQINTIPAKKARIANQLRPLNPEIKVLPIGEEDEKRARVRTGLLKSIQKKSGAEAIYDQCFGQMLSTSMSFMRVKADYVAPDRMDQELKIEFIPNWHQVYYDYNYKSPIYKDMIHGAIDIKMPRDEYQMKFGGNVSEASMPTTIYDYTQDEKDYINITEYYRINETSATAVIISNGQELIQGYSDDVRILQLLALTTQEGENVWKKIDDRKTFKRQLEWYMVNGFEVLDKRLDMPGQYIPIIPCEGRQLWVDGKRNLVSYIHNMKTPAQMKNYAKSLEVEMLAYQPLNVWQAPKGSWEEYAEYYRKANNQSFPVLPYNSKDKDGSPLAPPQKIGYSGPQNQLAGTFQTYDKDINDITGDFDELSQTNGQLRSGIAIDLKQRAGGITNYDYVDNFITRTLTYMGVVLNDLLPDYYTIDRAYSIIGDEDKSERIQEFDLTGGEYDVEVHIGAASDTERKESSETLLTMLQNIPGMQNAAYIVAKNMDNLKDKDDLVKILKAQMPPEILQVLETDEAQLSVENMQLKQQMQQVQAENEQAKQLIQSMQIDYKKAMDVQALKSETDIKRELIKSSTTLKDQELENSGDIMQEVIKHIDLLTNKMNEIELKVEKKGESVSIETEK
jgi:hypothetical protein